MQGIDAKDLLDALLAEEAHGQDARSREALHQSAAPAAAVLAQQVFEAHEDERPCPPRARHRAYALLEAMPASVWEVVGRLLFDSWRQLAPAARSLGTERLMRFATDLGAVDVQLGRDPLDETIQIALAVEADGMQLEAELVVRGDEPETRHVRLDEDGTGSIQLGKGGTEIEIVVRDEMGTLLRTPPISVR